MFGEAPIDRMMPEPLPAVYQRARIALCDERLVAALAQALTTPACRVAVVLHCKDARVIEQSITATFTPTGVRSRGGRGGAERSYPPLSRDDKKSGENPTLDTARDRADSD